jgi:hypothetical protein
VFYVAAYHRIKITYTSYLGCPQATELSKKAAIRLMTYSPYPVLGVIISSLMLLFTDMDADGRIMFFAALFVSVMWCVYLFVIAPKRIKKKIEAALRQQSGIYAALRKD